MIDFSVSYKETDSIDGFEVVSGLTATSYTIIGLLQGVEYQIKVQSRNEFGLSDYSSEIVVLVAQIPDQPTNIATTISGDNVMISWDVPNDRGSPLLSYIVYIRKSDGTTFDIDMTNCDGSDPTILANAECYVPISTLRASSFQLQWGASVWAKVVAVNLYGQSFHSIVANGAVILRAPDTPLNVQEIVASRSATSISFEWDKGALEGGSPVIDFRIRYDQGTSTWIDLQLNVVNEYYTATGLTAGDTYQFTVEARNKFGYSLPTAPVSILCATRPGTPTALTTTVLADQVKI